MPSLYRRMRAEERQPFRKHDVSRSDYRWLFPWNHAREKNSAELIRFFGTEDEKPA